CLGNKGNIQIAQTVAFGHNPSPGFASSEWQRGQCTETVITWKPQIVAEYHKSQLFKGITNHLSYISFGNWGATRTSINRAD
ncbi:hypothetical protein CE195_05650, partial [Sodalis-like symbiont of Philaenus spumarius]